MLHHNILDRLEDSRRREILGTLKPVRVPVGQILFSAGDHCQGLPLILSGRVKVQMTGVSGNSIVLYRIDPDDVCTLSIGCLMTGRSYRAAAIVEEVAEILLIPRGMLDHLMSQSRDFRLGVMESYGRRLDDLMLLVEEVAFRRMDQRLEEWLESHINNGSVSVTHQQIAVELGTAREVVSRLLKELEKQGRIELSRGHIRLIPE